jgi:hypothetical protein
MSLDGLKPRPRGKILCRQRNCDLEAGTWAALSGYPAKIKVWRTLAERLRFFKARILYNAIE